MTRVLTTVYLKITPSGVQLLSLLLIKVYDRRHLETADIVQSPPSNDFVTSHFAMLILPEQCFHQLQTAPLIHVGDTEPFEIQLKNGSDNK